MPIHRSRLMRLIRRAWARHAPDIRELAVRTWTIAPGGTQTVQAALYPPGEAERIAALSPWRTWDTEQAMLRGGEVRHDPSLAHELRNVAIAGAYLYCAAAKDRRGHGQEKGWFEGKPAEDLAQAVLVSSRFGSDFFGTHLQYDFPLALLAEQIEAPPVSLVTAAFPHASDYRALCGVRPARLLEWAHVRCLTLFSDHAENDSKAQRYRELRRRLRSSLAAAQAGPTRAATGVYIRRGRSGELRLLENEPEVEAWLMARGFAVVDPQTQSALEIAHACLDAPIIVSVEGSQLSHAIFAMADAGAMLVLQPPGRFSLSYKEFTDRLDMRFGFVVGEPSPTGFTLQPSRLGWLLDRLL